MISVRKAQQLILANVKKGRAGRVGLLASAGRVLAGDILSPEDLPRFDQSAMDGYAVRPEELGSTKLKISREIYAGGALSPALKAGECAYITTGSIVPPNAGAVLPVEDVLAGGGLYPGPRKGRERGQYPPGRGRCPERLPSRRERNPSYTPGCRRFRRAGDHPA